MIIITDLMCFYAGLVSLRIYKKKYIDLSYLSSGTIYTILCFIRILQTEQSDIPDETGFLFLINVFSLYDL